MSKQITVPTKNIRYIIKTNDATIIKMQDKQVWVCVKNMQVVDKDGFCLLTLKEQDND